MNYLTAICRVSPRSLEVPVGCAQEKLPDTDTSRQKLPDMLTAIKLDDRREPEVESSLVGLPDFKSGARG